MKLRTATPADVPALEAIIEASVRRLGAEHYDAEQIEASLRHLFSVDTLLVRDGTYFIVEMEGEPVGCGGWSRRRTPFGGDRAGKVRDAGLRDPASEPAVLRAFFVHPAWARCGLGRLLVEASEAAARREGFSTFELTSTLPGLPLYTALGYRAVAPCPIHLPGAVLIEAVTMAKP